jgi:mRNA interferase MazF
VPEPRQGEIWWADLPAPSGRRPVLVLTRSRALPVLSNVTVAPLTRTGRGVPAEVGLEPAEGVPTACVVTLENILTVRKSALDRRITTISREKMQAVFAAIRFVFDMPQ